MRIRRILLVIVALSLTLSIYAMPDGGPLVQDPGGTTAGGSCTYCSQTRCGCASAPLGYRLDYSCTCSSLTCTRSCDYTPI